mmetsp:Transcript_15093/g.33273  ORF Transcript_15093/g.33273 Transcript_15093/m.33273 type:complete len:251 (-) Transcript_15093:279-1031(-)|eukprot:CAMPEP_0204316158 /NCGR_PEP_ID=MMETSP0469-20131031/5238_1 /ASSEMBLY_ACC=CAM_ASM_000384 /TAXON_ID=2969 /ORGANISM="Oxyrrhis marina" /LENGTH=250 /DNA_ID=CAMNT_0051296897 /DNA_START=35 /DNA_END=787 /DNA_ORIENTATION=-
MARKKFHEEWEDGDEEDPVEQAEADDSGDELVQQVGDDEMAKQRALLQEFVPADVIAKNQARGQAPSFLVRRYDPRELKKQQAAEAAELKRQRDERLATEKEEQRAKKAKLDAAEGKVADEEKEPKRTWTVNPVFSALFKQKKEEVDAEVQRTEEAPEAPTTAGAAWLETLQTQAVTAKGVKDVTASLPTVTDVPPGRHVTPFWRQRPIEELKTEWQAAAGDFVQAARDLHRASLRRKARMEMQKKPEKL